MSGVDPLFATMYREDGSHGPMTLPEYASRFLADIEHCFGPRDHSFVLVGIDIDKTPNNRPRLWFPDSGIQPDDTERRSRHVVIRLGSSALTDPVRARWQLAHECFHLLDPWSRRVDGRPTNWLEEGLAAWYQNTRVPEAEWHEGSYTAAEALVRPLLVRPLMVRTSDGGLVISSQTYSPRATNAHWRIHPRGVTGLLSRIPNGDVAKTLPAVSVMKGATLP